jgi:hypothetical protein
LNGPSSLFHRSLLLVIAGLLVAIGPLPGAKAQEVRIGVRFGPTFGFLNDNSVPFTSKDAEINANPRLDLHVGAYAVVPVTDHVALQPELLYVQKGSHFSRPRSQSYAVERYRLSYVQGALLSRRDVSLPGPLSLHLTAGLTADVALRGTLQRNLRSRDIDFEQQVSLMASGQLRRWDVGGLVGVGVGYPIGPTSRLALELRYNRGFRAVFHAERSAGSSSDPQANPFPLADPGASFRHDVVTASLTYTLPLTALF